MIEFGWGRMDAVEIFDICRYKLILRFNRRVCGAPMLYQAKIKMLGGGPAMRAWRVVSADRAEAMFDRIEQGTI